MKITKQQLMTITNLNSGETLDTMDDAQFEEYLKSLDDFIQELPHFQDMLKNAFESKNAEEFSKPLLSVMDTLTKIHANGLAQNSFNLLDCFREGKHVMAETLLNEFLTAVSTLSIDIQMAQYKTVNEAHGNTEKDTSVEKDPVQKSILAVDDVSFLLNTLKAVLLNSGYKFTGVISGETALKFLQNHKPDLFILDIEMPGMNGYELAKKIRDMGQRAPIIFLTGNATSDYVLKAIQAGAADFIVKPVSKGCVLEKIKKYIGD